MMHLCETSLKAYFLIELKICSKLHSFIKINTNRKISKNSNYKINLYKPPQNKKYLIEQNVIINKT